MPFPAYFRSQNISTLDKLDNSVASLLGTAETNVLWYSSPTVNPMFMKVIVFSFCQRYSMFVKLWTFWRLQFGVLLSWIALHLKGVSNIYSALIDRNKISETPPSVTVYSSTATLSTTSKKTRKSNHKFRKHWWNFVRKLQLYPWLSLRCCFLSVYVSDPSR